MWCLMKHGGIIPEARIYILSLETAGVASGSQNTHAPDRAQMLTEKRNLLKVLGHNKLPEQL